MVWVQKTNGYAAFFGRTCLKCVKPALTKSSIYRTKEFDGYYKGYLKTSEISLTDAIKKWETQYRPHIRQTRNTGSQTRERRSDAHI